MFHSKVTLRNHLVLVRSSALLKCLGMHFLRDHRVARGVHEKSTLCVYVHRQNMLLIPQLMELII